MAEPRRGPGALHASVTQIVAQLGSSGVGEGQRVAGRPLWRLLPARWRAWVHGVGSTVGVRDLIAALHEERQSLVEQVKQYIERQAEHHRRQSYQDEFRALCTKHGVEIDERYVWD